MIKLLILADDLTGALDTGVQFTQRGISTKVYLYNGKVPEFPEEQEAVVLDLESRHVSPEEANRRVKTAVLAAMKAGVDYIYKKVDSTQRGNIGSEMDGAMDASGKRRLFYAPSYPAQKRSVREGVLYVGDKRLLESGFQNDHFSEICHDYLPDIVARQSDRSASVHTLDALKSGSAERDDSEIIVLDAETENELHDIAEYLIGKYGKDVVYSGSAGLANAMAGILGSNVPEELPIRKHSKTLVICGSLNETSHRQIDCLEQGGVPSVYMDEKSLLGMTDEYCCEADRLFIEVCNLLKTNDVVALRTNSQNVDCDTGSGKDCASCGDMPKHICVASGTGRLTSRILHTMKLSQIVVIGGDTLFGVLKNIGCADIKPRCEILPGVIYSEVRLEGGTVIDTYSKAGGFGTDETLNSVVGAITRSSKAMEVKRT